MSMNMETLTKQQIADLGLAELESKSQHLFDLYNSKCPKFLTEYYFVRDYIENLAGVKIVSVCGTLCFYKVNKTEDTEVSKDEMMAIMKSKLKKDLDTINSLEEKAKKAELTAKENKSILLGYTALRTSIMLHDLIQNLDDEVVFIVGTRGSTKVSVDNFSLTGFDCGSGTVMQVKNKDALTINNIKDAALSLAEGKFVTVTGGDYETRKASVKMIRDNIESVCSLTEEEMKKIYYKIQPIRPEVEKTCILDQRKLFLSDERYLLIQGGNRDAVFVDSKKSCR